MNGSARKEEWNLGMIQADVDKARAAIRGR
jgi:hypothetical protein